MFRSLTDEAETSLSYPALSSWPLPFAHSGGGRGRRGHHRGAPHPSHFVPLVVNTLSHAVLRVLILMIFLFPVAYNFVGVFHNFPENLKGKVFEVLFADDGTTRSSFEKCRVGCWVGLSWRSEGLDLGAGERPLRLPQLSCFASCHPWRPPSPVDVPCRRGRGPPRSSRGRLPTHSYPHVLAGDPFHSHVTLTSNSCLPKVLFPF